MTPETQEASARAGLRSDLYDFLSRVLSPPDRAHGSQALQVGFMLCRAEIIPPAARDLIRRLTDTLARHDPQGMEREWQATFSLTDGGPLSLCETEYGMAHVFQKTSTLADIAGFYRAFGLERADGAERPDHLSVEFEFLSILAIKQVRALRTGMWEAASVSRSAESLFLSEHTGRFAPGLFKRMKAAGGFYASVADAGLAAIEWILSEQGLSMPDQLDPSGPGVPDEPLSCGQCPLPIDHG